MSRHNPRLTKLDPLSPLSLGNGGLLYAIAMMARGWKGGPSLNAPGFPSDGSWTIRSENIRLAE